MLRPRGLQGRRLGARWRLIAGCVLFIATLQLHFDATLIFRDAVFLSKERLSCDVEMDRLSRGIDDDITEKVDPQSVAVLTVFGGSNGLALKKYVSGNRKTFTDWHGYTYIEIASQKQGSKPQVSVNRLVLGRDWDERNFQWGKLSVIWNIFEQLDEIEYIFLLDADMVLTNLAVSLNFLIAQNRDLIVGGDQNGINTGIMLLRRSPWTTKLLQCAFRRWPVPFPNWPGEQGSISACLEIDQDIIESKTPSDISEIVVRNIVSHREQHDVDVHVRRLPSQTQEHVLFLPKCILNHDLRSHKSGAFSAHFAGSSPRDKARYAWNFVKFKVRTDELLTLRRKSVLLPVQKT